MDIISERRLWLGESRQSTATQQRRQSATGRSYYALRKKRKSHSPHIHAAQRSQSINDAGGGEFAECGNPALRKATADGAAQLSKLQAATAATDSKSVCVICRQAVEGCCLHCCEAYAKSNHNNSSNVGSSGSNILWHGKNRRLLLHCGNTATGAEGQSEAKRVTSPTKTSQSCCRIAALTTTTAATTRVTVQQDERSNQCNVASAPTTIEETYSNAAITTTVDAMPAIAPPNATTTRAPATATNAVGTNVEQHQNMMSSNNIQQIVDVPTTAPPTTSTTGVFEIFDWLLSSNNKLNHFPQHKNNSNNSNYNNNNSINSDTLSSKHHRESNKRQIQQQRPPFIRLIRNCCNSYYNKATNIFNASRKQAEEEEVPQQQSPPTHQPQSQPEPQAQTSPQRQQQQQQDRPPPLQQLQPADIHRTTPHTNCCNRSGNSGAKHQQKCPQHHQRPLRPHHHNNYAKHSSQPALLWPLQFLRHFKTSKVSSSSTFYLITTILSFLTLTLTSINAQASNGLKPFVVPSSPSSASLAAALETRLAASTGTGGGGGGDSGPSQVSLYRNETVCRSLDIRNTPSELSHLSNCTVIEGFLLITLMNTHNPQEFTQSFPLLTEVTEFIIIYRVHNLRSLSQLFPNLSIIRGTTLFESYAFIVYSNPHLEDLGLSKLTTISRGGVRIESNVMLCFVQTIAWKRIVASEGEITLENNRKLIECPKCPGDTKTTSLDGVEHEEICKEFDGQRRCWNSRTCQKICPDNCPNNCDDKNNCCHEACLGGCLANNNNVCISCRNFSIYNNTCIDKCPSNYFSYLNRRCITAEECIRIGTKFENNKSQKIVPYDGKCSTRCPTGYNKIGTTCQACGDNCVMRCVGGLIDSVERAKEFLGCTHIIKNGLTISIKRGGRHLMEELEYGLSSIQVINTYLKIQGTFGMISLAFFKHLQSIGGDPLYEDKFALYALENNDLETLWAANQTVRINKGRVFFHFNPKLCFSEIKRLLPMMKDNEPFDKNEVASDSNGHKGSCDTEMLIVNMTKISSRVAIANIVNPLKFGDERTFIGYQYFYMEAKHRNATKYSQRVCDDGWIVSDPTKEPHYIFINLKPYTQYAYYVKTWTISSEKRNAQSPIQYFKTKSAQPKFVQTLNAYASSESEIRVTWSPPLIPQGNLTIYRVRAMLDTRSQVLQSRNYCKDPAQIDKEEEAKDPTRDTQLAVTDQPPNATNCKCDKDKSPSHDVDTSEATILAGIDFENTLQNFIYVKNSNDSDSDKSRRDDDESGGAISDMDAKRRRRHSEGAPEESFLRRHMRAIPDDFEDAILTTTSKTDNSNSDISISTSAPLIDAHNASQNVSRMDSTNSYYEFIVVNVSVATTSYTFTNLKHFSIYQLGVEACREPEVDAPERECSDIRIRYVRTKKKEGVDLVQNLVAELEATNTTRPSVRLRWDPPEQPNGDVVSYTISYILMTQDAVEEKRCITDVDYRNNTKGYLLSGLQTGNYSIKVRANSLAGDGVYSDPVYKYIPAKKLAGIIIAIIVIAAILVVALIIAVYCYVRKRYAPPKDLKMFPTVNPYYISPQYIPDDWEVARDRVIQLNPLGQGSFGMVYEGLLKGHNNSTEDTRCAIKTVNENATDRERMNFLNEASVMKQFDTYHVVRLLGVCSVGQPALVVMELMSKGDLKLYLRAHRPDERDSESTVPFIRGEPTLQPPSLSRIYQMAIEIADGMAYLAFKKFVHRDLAARNCMVAEDLTVKIGDFGMTRDIYETDYYRKGTKGLLPVRWMPPESLRDGVYSTASDVFSFGVVLWEIVTLASQPYPGYSNDQVLSFVIEGGVMERPENCPDKIYEIMQQCWEHRPSKRPSFLKIIRTLLEYVDTDNDGYLQHFHDVSFYFSAGGQQEREKERTGTKNSGDVFHEHDNEMDDLTTPLRMNEYTDYKFNLGNTSSVEHAGESPMAIDDDQPHSPYSLASAIVVSSTPDGQSKNSYNLSQMSHNNPTLLSSVPSTSAGIISGGSHSHSHQLQQPRHPQVARYGQYPSGEDTAAYVQPDFDPRTHFGGSNTDTQLGAAGKSIETDERGYEMYDPSPNYRPFASYNTAADEEEFGFRAEGGDKDGRFLVPSKSSRQREPLIMPMSSSMPDDVKNAPMASSLHPSTASAASSNASSTATTTGRSYLKKRFGNINLRFFNHKRSGSNASHKSTSSNPNTNTSSSSNSNLAGGASGRGKSISGQNLGTIESGGSGSAGSYCPQPRFFTPITRHNESASEAANTSDNPNYRLLDETNNASSITAAGDVTSGPTTSTPAKASPTMRGKGPTGFAISGNPTYQRLDESVNATLTPDKPTAAVSSDVVSPATTRLQTSEIPKYPQTSKPLIGAGGAALPLSMTDNPNYVMMSEPALMPPAQPPHASSTSPIAFAHMSENPNYKPMGPVHRLHSDQGSSASSLGADPDDELDYDDNEGDDEDKDDGATDHIRMELLGRNRAAVAKPKRVQPEWSDRPRNFSLKEEWLRGQDLRGGYRGEQPPPNGFIGVSGVVEPEKPTEQSKKKLDAGGGTHTNIGPQPHRHI